MTESIFCPRCGMTCGLGEWQLIFRWLRHASSSGPPARVLRHKLCKEIVYVLLK